MIYYPRSTIFKKQNRHNFVKSKTNYYIKNIANKLHCYMIHIGQIIEDELHSQERSITWFANKLFCDRTNVYKIFKRTSIDSDLLLRISHILNHNFFNYYLEELKNNEKKNTP